MEDLVKLLQKEQLYQATKGQDAVQKDLSQLLQLLLSGERDKQISDERTEIKRFIDRINKLIREEQGILGETEGQGDAKELARRQGNIAGKAAELSRDLDRLNPKNAESGNDNSGDAKDQNGEPSDGKADGKSDGKSDENSDKNAKGNSDGKSGENAEGKSGDNKSADGKSQDGKSRDGKKAGDNKSGDQKSGENANGENGKDSPEGKSGSKANSKSGNKSGKSGSKSGSKRRG